jgi:hypothetical protein
MGILWVQPVGMTMSTIVIPTSKERHIGLDIGLTLIIFFNGKYIIKHVFAQYEINTGEKGTT